MVVCDCKRQNLSFETTRLKDLTFKEETVIFLVHFTKKIMTFDLSFYFIKTLRKKKFKSFFRKVIKNKTMTYKFCYFILKSPSIAKEKFFLLKAWKG